VNFFNKSTSHPTKRYIYAVTTGAYVGEMLVYMESQEQDHIFLTVPDMKKREIPKTKFDQGLKIKIIDIVEKLPSHVYKTCRKQFEKVISEENA